MSDSPTSVSSGRAAVASSATFLGHPLGLATLFFLEMWERFSYYGMRALLILFMTATAAHGGLGLDPERAGAVYGLYTAGVYLCSMPGGWVADRLLGQRRSVFWGGVLIALGNFMLVIPSALPLFYGGLAVVALGTGLLKPNVSVMVGSLYGDDSSSRRDAGFSIFYLGINLGAFIAPFLAGTIGETVGYRWGFAASGCAMVLGLFQYRASARPLGDVGLRPHAGSDATRARNWRLLCAALSVLLVIALGAAAGLWRADVRILARLSGVLMTLLAVVFFAGTLIFGKLTRAEQRRVAVIGLFFLSACIFWAGYEQAGTTLNLFARDQTDRSLFGHFFASGQHPASWYQSIAPVFVLLLAPVFAWAWIALGRRHLEPAAPTKLGLGLAQLGVSFLVMMLAAQLVAASGQRVGPSWLIVTYLLQTTGELCLSPIGLSNVTKLAPARFASQMMGTWFLGTALGNLAAGLIGGGIGAGNVHEMPGQFLQMALIGLVSGAVLLAIARPVRRWMGSVE
jgi:proton-dependent oligopeptide transporter, POT family